MRSIRSTGIILILVILSVMSAGCFNVQSSDPKECWDVKSDDVCQAKADAVKSGETGATPMSTVGVPAPMETIVPKGSIFSRSELNNKGAVIYNSTAITVSFDPYPFIRIDSKDKKAKRVVLTITDRDNSKNVWQKNIYIQDQLEYIKISEAVPPYERFTVSAQVIYPKTK